MLLCVHSSKIWPCFEENLILQSFRGPSQSLQFWYSSQNRTMWPSQVHQLIQSTLLISKPCLRIRATAWEMPHYFQTSIRLLLVLPDSREGNPKLNRAYSVGNKLLNTTFLAVKGAANGKVLLYVFWIWSYCIIAVLSVSNMSIIVRNQSSHCHTRDFPVRKCCMVFVFFRSKTLGGLCRWKWSWLKVIIAFSFGRV